MFTFYEKNLKVSFTCIIFQVLLLIGKLYFIPDYKILQMFLQWFSLSLRLGICPYQQVLIAQILLNTYIDFAIWTYQCTFSIFLLLKINTRKIWSFGLFHQKKILILFCSFKGKISMSWLPVHVKRTIKYNSSRFTF